MTLAAVSYVTQEITLQIMPTKYRPVPQPRKTTWSEPKRTNPKIKRDHNDLLGMERGQYPPSNGQGFWGLRIKGNALVN
jgi:hypothetical protein